MIKYEIYPTKIIKFNDKEPITRDYRQTFTLLVRVK